VRVSERRIEHVLAFEALDSRGTPTVACVVTLAGGARACATVPAGASTGRHEAHERRDGGQRYAGRGVREAVAAVNGEIAAKLRGHDAGEQAVIDAALRDLDGTPSLARLGANAVLAASLASALAAAEAARTPLWRLLSPAGAPLLPRPMVNVLSGGAHAGRAVDVQDVLVIPLGATTFAAAI
jgi:enolase